MLYKMWYFGTIIYYRLMVVALAVTGNNIIIHGLHAQTVSSLTEIGNKSISMEVQIICKNIFEGQKILKYKLI